MPIVTNWCRILSPGRQDQSVDPWGVNCMRGHGFIWVLCGVIMFDMVLYVFFMVLCHVRCGFMVSSSCFFVVYYGLILGSSAFY